MFRTKHRVVLPQVDVYMALHVCDSADIMLYSIIVRYNRFKRSQLEMGSYSLVFRSMCVCVYVIWCSVFRPHCRQSRQHNGRLTVGGRGEVVNEGRMRGGKRGNGRGGAPESIGGVMRWHDAR